MFEFFFIASFIYFNGNYIICKHFIGFWLHTRGEDGANATGLRPTERNRRSHNDAI